MATRQAAEREDSAIFDVQNAPPELAAAAASAIDPDRLIEGEDPATIDPAEARHWVLIYSEMMAYKEELMERTRRHIDGMQPAARDEIRSVDLALLGAQAERIRHRLDFWQRRHWELAGIDFDEAGRGLHYRGRTAVLTKRESQLLAVFLSRPNRGFTAQELLGEAWHDPQLAPEQVRTYMGRLRHILADLGMPCEIIVLPGRRGYSLSFLKLP